MNDIVITISFLVLILGAIFIVLLVLKRQYHYSWIDLWNAGNHADYRMFTIAQHQFIKVKEGLQPYSLYKKDMHELYGPDTFKGASNKFSHTRFRNTLVILEDLLEDEELIRRYFSKDTLTYAEFIEMIEIWKGRSSLTDKKAETEHQVETKKAKAKPKVNFKDCLTPNAPDNLEDYVSKYVKVRKSADDLLHLFMVLQENSMVQCKYTEFFGCLRNSFPDDIVIEERTFRYAYTKRKQTTRDYDIRENARIENAILEQIQNGLNP